MSHKVQVTLTNEQHKWAVAHAAKKGRTPAEDLIHVWWNRVQALERYAVKLEDGEPMRAYAPKGLPEEERERLKAAAIKAGVAVKPGAKKAPAKPRGKPRTVADHEKPAKKRRDPDKAPAPASLSLGGVTILRTDSASGAAFKAQEAAKATKRTIESILAAAGRDRDGVML